MTNLVITQGDTVTFQFTATNGEGQPFDLTGATLTTYVRGSDGEAISFPNSQHTINPDQVFHKGEFTLALTTDDTNGIPLGIYKEVVTKVVQSSSTIYFRGKNILTVYPKIPIQ